MRGWDQFVLPSTDDPKNMYDNFLESSTKHQFEFSVRSWLTVGQPPLPVLESFDTVIGTNAAPI